MPQGIRVGYTLDELHEIVRKEPPLEAVLQSQTALIRRHEQILLTVIEERLWGQRPHSVTDEGDAEALAHGKAYDEGWMDCFSALAEVIQEWGDAP